jgi:myo-inositol 2-dehydrogenase / D-chiro-inositol 1-dehydrogenase
MEMKTQIETTDSKPITRRDFIKTSSIAASAAAVGVSYGATKPITPFAAERAAHPAGNDTIKVALVGCGGRGTGAARDCLEAGKVVNVNVKFTMLADVFDNRMARSREELAKLGVEVPGSGCLLGFAAYKKVMESDVDLVLLATPPNFRPIHFAAAVAGGKHVFMEKPVAVDPAGCRAIIEAGKHADTKKLSVVTGTQRRHERGYLAVAQAVKDGAIGKILGGTIHFCLGGGGPGLKPAETPDWEWMIRHWGGWCELSGDHIVEQHVHSIDVMNWFLGAHPIRCVSFGGRAQRKGGNMYDFFSTDYEFSGGVHIHSLCRQVNGIWGRVGQSFRGDKGIVDVQGLVAADKTYVGGADRKSRITLPKFEGHENSYIQEHVDLLSSILCRKAINEAQAIAESTLTAIMGRISAYTGEQITWDDMMESSLACRPSAGDFEAGTVKMPPEVPPVPGKA